MYFQYMNTTIRRYNVSTIFVIISIYISIGERESIRTWRYWPTGCVYMLYSVVTM